MAARTQQIRLHDCSRETCLWTIPNHRRRCSVRCRINFAESVHRQGHPSVQSANALSEARPRKQMHVGCPLPGSRSSEVGTLETRSLTDQPSDRLLAGHARLELLKLAQDVLPVRRLAQRVRVALEQAVDVFALPRRGN